MNKKNVQNTHDPHSSSEELVHVPVLLQEVLEYTNAQASEVVFDGTYGAGGYSRALLERVGGSGRVIATDQDPTVHAREINQNLPDNLTLVHANFRELEKVTEESGVEKFDVFVLDLGISSDQLADRERGISFQYEDAPLDMRMNTSEGNDLTAWGILNVWEEEEIADLLYRYADERASRKIARAIVERREEGELDTVGDLTQAVSTVIKPFRGSNPATKTFQALRIAVNKELEVLEDFLDKVEAYAAPGARVVVVLSLIHI